MTLLSMQLFGHCACETGIDSDTMVVSESEPVDVNPATGLPIVSGSGIDVGGSPRGTDIHEDHFIEAIPVMSMDDSAILSEMDCGISMDTGLDHTSCTGFDDFMDSAFSCFDSDW